MRAMILLPEVIMKNINTQNSRFGIIKKILTILLFLPFWSYAANITLSGKTAFKNVSDGVVVITNSNGAEIAKTRTLTDGSYSVSVDASALSGGYTLTLTETISTIVEGTQKPTITTDTMTASYGGSHPSNKANITGITTLVSEMAKTTGSQTKAIQKLVDFGMVNNNDWYAVSSPRINPKALEAVVSNYAKITEWTAQLISDMADSELALKNLACFPKVYGGVAAISFPATDEGVFHVFKGYNDEIKAFSSLTEENLLVTWSLINPPKGITIDSKTGIISVAGYYAADPNTFLFLDSFENQSSQQPVQPTTTNNTVVQNTLTVQAQTAYGKRQKQIEIAALPPITLIDETTIGGAQLMSDKFDLVKVNIAEENTVPVGTRVKIIGNKKITDELWTFRTIVSSENSKGVSIGFTDSAVLNEAYKIEIGQRKSMSLVKRSTASWHEWSNLSSYATFLGNARWHNEHQESSFLPQVSLYFLSYITVGLIDQKTSHEKASQVFSNKYPHTQIKGKIPIIFIHGYTPKPSFFLSGFGGGDSTWGNFRDYAASWKFEEKETAIFDFQWKTNTRFELAADDLRRVVETISQKTGEPVHIIAHSFGGVLARTYLQGLAQGKTGYSSVPVASLTTIGSPHSGLGYRGGYDSSVSGWIAKGCGQISCYQMGDPRIISDIKLISKENEITEKLDTNDFLLTDQKNTRIPIQALMSDGLDNTGDDLISLDGQRFKPADYPNDQLRNNTVVNNAVVTEIILGKGKNIKYAHTGQQCNISYICKPEVEVSSPNHPSVQKAKSWIAQYLGSSLNNTIFSYQFKAVDSSNKLIATLPEPKNVDYRIAKVKDGYFEIRVKYQPGKRVYVSLIPPKNSGLLKPRNDFYFDMPMTYGLGWKQHNNTIIFRGVSQTTINKSPIINSAVDTSINELKIKGDNFRTPYVTLQMEWGNNYAGTVLSSNSKEINVQFNGLTNFSGARRVCVENKNTDGSTSVKKCTNFIRSKLDNNKLKITSFSPTSIKQNTSGQAVVIKGSGFTPKTQIYWATATDSGNRFSSARYIDSNTMAFAVTTSKQSSYFTIWVEDEQTKSEKKRLPIDQSVNGTCQANEVETQTCSIVNGSGRQQRTCSTDGNSWGTYSACQVSTCETGYHISSNQCVADINPNQNISTPTLSPAKYIIQEGAYFTWNELSNVTYYEMAVIGTDNNTNRRIRVEDSNSHFISALEPQRGYKVKVRGCNSHHCGSYSNVINIETASAVADNAPKGLVPAPNGYHLAVAWLTLEGATEYQIRLYDSNDNHIESKIVTGTGTIFLNLSPSKTYEVKVRALINGDYGSYATQQFTLKSNENTVIPQNIQVSTTESSVTVNWNIVQGTTKYHLDIEDRDGNSDFSNYFTNNSIRVNGLKSNNRYRVRVRSYNDKGNSAYSDWRYFTTDQSNISAPKFVKVSPTGYRLVAAWLKDSSASGYQAVLLDDSNRTILTKDVNTNHTSFGDLASNKTYKFKVRTRVGGNYSNYTEYENSFNILYGGNQIIPQNIRTSSTQNSVTINWDEISGSTKYRVRIDDRDGNDDHSKYVTTNNATITGLKPNNRYRVKIRSYGKNDDSSYSNYYNFETNRGNTSSTCPPLEHFTPNKRIVQYLQRPYVDGYDGIYQVSELQKFLNAVQGKNMATDGIFGPQTEVAVKEFQVLFGLTADGKVGKQTRARINSICN